MNGVEYYRDRRVDRSQYKGLSFRLRDGLSPLELARLCAAPPRGGMSGGAAAPTRASTSTLHPAVECRPDGYSAAYAPCDRRHAPAKRQQCATTAWRMRNRAYERNRRSLSSVVPGSKRNRELMYADQ